MYTHIQTLMDISESYLGLVSYPRILSTQTEAARDRMINLFFSRWPALPIELQPPHNITMSALDSLQSRYLFIYYYVLLVI